MENKITSFFDLTSWQESHALALAIYDATKPFPQEERFGITSQVRRAVSSVGANIAEGFARYHFKDKVRFYHQARGSAAEVQNFIALARDLGYLDTQQASILIDRTTNVLQLINGLIRSIEKQQRITNYDLQFTNSK